jgi:hypothetical protein
MKVGKLFTSTNQPTYEQRCKGQKSRQWRNEIQNLVFGSQLELFVSPADMNKLYTKSKLSVSLDEFKKLEVNTLVAKNLINYMLLCKNISESKNALEVLRTIAHSSIDDLADKLEVQINLAENETLKSESSI